MICDTVRAKEIFEESLERSKKLRKTMAKTRDGELLDSTIATTEKALELLDARDFDALRTLFDTDMVSNPETTAFVEATGGEIEAAVGSNLTADSAREVLVVKSVEHISSKEHGDLLKITVEGQDGPSSFMFKDGNAMSTPLVEGDDVMLSPSLGSSVESAIKAAKGDKSAEENLAQAKKTRKTINEATKVLDDSESLDELLGNSENLSHEDFNYSRTSKVSAYKHGDKAHMKNMLNDLHAIGGRATTDEMIDQYHGILDGMHEHFFRSIDLFVNHNQEESRGWVDFDKGRMLINTSNNVDSSMSNAEVYMHETVHTLTAWGLRNSSGKAADLTSRLNFLRANAFKHVTWKDLMNADDKLSEQGAKARFDYIFDSATSNDEFLAFALTNPAFSGLLKEIKMHDDRSTGLWSSIKHLFVDILNAVMGNYQFSSRNSTVYHEVHALVEALGRINNQAEDSVTNSPNIFVVASRAIANMEGRFEEFVSENAGKLFDTDGEGKIPTNMSVVQKIMLYAKFFAKSIYNSNYRHNIGKYLTDHKLPATSSIREILRSVLPKVHEHLTIDAELAGLQSTNADRDRNNRVAEVGNSIIKHFDKTLTQPEEEALTLVMLESNAHTLFATDKNGGKGYSKAQLVRLLSEVKYREKAIAMAKKRIAKHSKKRANWITAQAEGLGIYMATGKGHKAQNSNSDNIVRGYLSSSRHDSDATLLPMVEELASLVAISHQKPADQKLVSDLLKKQEKGVKNIVHLYGSFVKQAKSSLFDGDASHILEGYARELFDDKIEVTYAVISKKAEMEAKGFKQVGEYESNDHSGAEAIGMFVSDTHTKPERLSGVIALGSLHSRGMTLKQARYAQFGDSPRHAHVWFEADKAKSDVEAVEINKKLMAGTPLSEIENGPVPVVDAMGDAVDYRYMMAKKDKRRLLKQNKKVTDVLAKTVGSVVDKVAREEINEKAEKLISKQIREVYDNPSSKDNLLEHTLIGPDHKDPEVRKLFYQLPRNLQRLANSRSDKSLPIPNMLMDTYFGYSQLKASDLYGLRSLPNSIKKILDMIESVWMDIVKIVKGNILLKMPAVLIQNVVSNVMFAVSTGTNPISLVADYGRSIKDVHRFMQRHQKVEKLTVELATLKQSYYTTRFGTDEDAAAHKGEVKRMESRIARLNKEMEGNPVKELFDLGMYQAVIEDVNMYKLGETNSLVDSLDGVMNKLPTAIRTPAQILYLSKETTWYKSNQYILQMSDLVARDVMNRKRKRLETEMVEGKRDLPYEYRKQIERLGSGDRKRILGGNEREAFLEYAKSARHKDLLNYFVNYNAPNGRGEEWFNRNGIFMFTKFIKKIQRVISDTGLKHPIYVGLTLAIVSILLATFGLDLETIQNSSAFVRVGDDYGLFGLTGIHTPDEIIATLVNPPLINLGEELLASH